MDVIMKGTISGTRNGEPWPDRGQRVSLPDDEARALIRTGMAGPADDVDEPELADLERDADPDGEKADADPDGEKADAAPTQAKTRAPRGGLRKSKS